MKLGDNIRSFRIHSGLTQKELAKKLSISTSAVGMYEQNRRMPDLDTLQKLAQIFDISIDDLIGSDNDKLTFGEINGFNGGDEDAVTFTQKLTFQMDVNSVTISDLSQAIGVSEKNIARWLDGDEDGAERYYDILSEFFKVQPSYWIRPHMISPGIELTFDEYMLILLYRNYQATSVLHEDDFISLEHCFPGIKVISEKVEGTTTAYSYSTEDRQWLSLIHQLPAEIQLEFRGEIKGYLKRLKEETVAAEELRQAK